MPSGECPTLTSPNTPPRAAPQTPMGSPMGGEIAFSCPSAGHGGWSGVPWAPHNSLYICRVAGADGRLSHWDLGTFALPAIRF